jgi:hypothetical protein
VDDLALDERDVEPARLESGTFSVLPFVFCDWTMSVGSVVLMVSATAAP